MSEGQWLKALLRPPLPVPPHLLPSLKKTQAPSVPTVLLQVSSNKREVFMQNKATKGIRWMQNEIPGTALLTRGLRGVIC